MIKGVLHLQMKTDQQSWLYYVWKINMPRYKFFKVNDKFAEVRLKNKNSYVNICHYKKKKLACTHKLFPRNVLMEVLSMNPQLFHFH